MMWARTLGHATEVVVGALGRQREEQVIQERWRTESEEVRLTGLCRKRATAYVYVYIYVLILMTASVRVAVVAEGRSMRKVKRARCFLAVQAKMQVSLRRVRRNERQKQNREAGRVFGASAHGPEYTLLAPKSNR
jgi:hypothetical protein